MALRLKLRHAHADQSPDHGTVVHATGGGAFGHVAVERERKILGFALVRQQRGDVAAKESGELRFADDAFGLLDG